MIPLIIDLNDKIVTIFGGGAVAQRKAAYFSGEADISVISRSFSPEFKRMGVRCLKYDIADLLDTDIERMLYGTFLAIAATSDPVQNERLGRISRSMGILFNSATDHQSSAFIPSLVRGKHYCIAVSTFGKSPGVPRYIRQVLEREVGDLDGMVELQQDIRVRLKEQVPEQEERTAILRAILEDPEIWDLVRTEPDLAKEKAIERYLK